MRYTESKNPRGAYHEGRCYICNAIVPWYGLAFNLPNVKREKIWTIFSDHSVIVSGSHILLCKDCLYLVNEGIIEEKKYEKYEK